MQRCSRPAWGLYSPFRIAPLIPPPPPPHLPAARRLESLQFAADTAAAVLPAYEKALGVPYALPKLDLVAIPDFSAGAMENWGAQAGRRAHGAGPWDRVRGHGAGLRLLRRDCAAPDSHLHLSTRTLHQAW